MKDYKEIADIFKALADPNRIMIIDMLSCGELCACKILERLCLSQPTLSHHMKILCQAELVRGRKEGKWMHYTLAEERFAELGGLVKELSLAKDDCICKSEADCCRTADQKAGKQAE